MLGCQSHADTPAKVVKAPDFTITDLQGKTLSLKELKGQVVFMDFWATWCPPCVVSSPEVEKLVEEYKGKKVSVLSISLDSGEGPVKRFLSTHKMTSRVFLAGESGIDISYQVDGIPAFFIIDPNGNITKAWTGYNPAMSSHWKKEIDRLLGL